MSPASDHETVFVDTISGLSDPLSSMSSVSSLIPLLTIAFQSEPQGQGRLLTLLNTISPPEHGKNHPHDRLVNSFIHFLNPVLQGMAGMRDFEAAVDGYSQPDNFCDFWTLEGKNLMTNSVQNESHGCSMDGFEAPFLKVFVKDPSCRVAYGRGEAGLVLVPGTAQVGDEIWSDNGKLRLRASVPNKDLAESVQKIIGGGQTV